ncbi:hypothetical protein [Roseibium sp.]|uniref:hypothetical protein n=1 Tax=Roseibium sp. TaxID=1936156 RepID=UPI003D101A9F
MADLQETRTGRTAPEHSVDAPREAAASGNSVTAIVCYVCLAILGTLAAIVSALR